MVRTAQGNKSTQCFHHNPQVLFNQTILSVAERVRSVSVRFTCGYVDILGVQHSLPPAAVAPDADNLIRVQLLGCSLDCKPLLNQSFHSLFPCDLFAAGEHTGKTTQTTGDNKTAVRPSKPRQTVEEIHVQQRATIVGNR